MVQERRYGDRRQTDRRSDEVFYNNRAGDVRPRIPMIRRLSDISEALSIRQNLQPGDVGWLVWLHGVIYAREQGWNHTFEAYVAGPLSDLVLRNNPRERIWMVECSDRVGISFDPLEDNDADSLPTLNALSLAGGEPMPPEAYPTIVGSIAIIEDSNEVAQIRWFLLTPELRGKGVGKRLIQEAITFCQEQGFKRVFLWTTSDLVDAARLYSSAGFILTESETHEIWGKLVTEQRYDLVLKSES
jgi:GNAT superfamily N-acetyltransferase